MRFYRCALVLTVCARHAILGPWSRPRAPCGALMQRDSLLTPQFSVPPIRSDRFPRQRLLPWLTKGTVRRPFLNTPPAGHGKTLLLSEGPTRCGQTGPQVRAAWLALDDGHCDPSPPILVRDRDRIIEPQPVGETLTFVLEYLPSHAVLITSTCRDPTLPLSPVRAVSTALMAAGAAPSTVWLPRSTISTRPQSRRSHRRPH